MKPYTHLTVFHRQIIGKLKKQGRSTRHIARILGVAPSTISREIKRNYCGFGYCCYIANDKAKSRRWRANQIHRKLDGKAIQFVAKKLKEKHSPEQIAAQFPKELDRSISFQALYRFLYTYQASRLGLRQLLRRKAKRYIPRSRRRAVVHNRPSIDQRPHEILQRSSSGHWEADLMEGPRNQPGALLVLVERKTRFVLTRFINERTAATVSAAIIAMLKGFLVETITYDNGTEFAGYRRVSDATKSSAFFCHPYHAWEKGTVENTIGLIREYFPKKTLVPTCRHTQLTVRKQLNRRPRKTLGFCSPQSLVDSIKKTA